MSPLSSPFSGFSRRAASFFQKARPLHPKQVDADSAPTSTKVAPHTYSPDSETTVVGSGSVAAIHKSTLTVALTDRVATVQRKSAHPWSTSVSLGDGASEISWTRLPPLVARAQLGPVVGEAMFPTAEKKYAKYRKRQAAATGSKRWSGAESVEGKMEAKLMMHKDEVAFSARMPFPLESLELLLNLLVYTTTPAPTQTTPTNSTFPPRGITPTPQHITITRDLVSRARNHTTTSDIAATFHTAFHHGFPDPTSAAAGTSTVTDLVLATILATLQSALKKIRLFADTPTLALFALADLIPAPTAATQPTWLWPAILATCPLSIRIAVVQVVSVAGVLATRFPESSVTHALIAPMLANRHSADVAVVDRLVRWMVRANRAWMRHVAEDATATYARERLDALWVETAVGGVVAAEVPPPMTTTAAEEEPVKAVVPTADVTEAEPVLPVLARDRASLERACNITDLRLVHDGSVDTSDVRDTIECTSVLPSIISMNRPVGDGVPVGGATDGKRLAAMWKSNVDRAQTLPIRRAGGD